MIRKGSLVQCIKESTGRRDSIWNGRYLSVAERQGRTLKVYLDRTDKGRWRTATVDIDSVKEIVE